MRDCRLICSRFFFFFQAEDGIRDHCVTGVQTCALPICGHGGYGGAGLFAHAAAPGVLPGRGIQRGAYAGGDFHLRADGGGAGVPSFRPFPCARLSMEHSTLQGRFQARFFWTVLALLALAVFPLVAPALGLDFYISFLPRVLIYALAATSLNLILGYGGMVRSEEHTS